VTADQIHIIELFPRVDLLFDYEYWQAHRLQCRLILAPARSTHCEYGLSHLL
jgi:hypothetical protein